MFYFRHIPDELERNYFLKQQTFANVCPSNLSQLTLPKDLRKTTRRRSKRPTLRSSRMALISRPTCFLSYRTISFLALDQTQHRTNVSYTTTDQNLASSNGEFTVYGK